MINCIKPNDRIIVNLNVSPFEYTEQKKEALRDELAKKYNVTKKQIEINYIPVLALDENGQKMSLTSEVVKNIQDPFFQKKLFNDYIQINNIENVDIDEINKIDDTVNAYIDFDAYSKYKSYTFKYVKWSNYLSYGSDNYFDFTKLHGLILLNGQPENQSGKTTFAIDLLRFALFGKADKSPTLDSVFNKFRPEETEVSVEACIEIDGYEYIIRRTITRPTLKRRTNKSKCKQKIEYFKKVGDECELIENCEGETGAQTNNIIRESVGTIDDFNLIISATSYTLGDLIRMNQTDKGKLFSKWLGLLTIEQKSKIANDIYKTKIVPNFLPSKYNKTVLEDEKENFKAAINSNNKKMLEFNATINDCVTKIERYNKEKYELLSSKKEIKKEVVNLDVTTVENSCKYEEENLNNFRGSMQHMKLRYNEIKDATFNKEELDKVNNDKIDYIKRNSELKVIIGHIQSDNKHIENLIKLGKCPTCGSIINKTDSLNEINNNNIKINELIEEGKKNAEIIKKLDDNILFFEKQKSETDELHSLKLKMTSVKVQIDNSKLKIENFKRTLNEIEINRENILLNNDIDNKIRIVDENIKSETNTKETYIRELESTKNENIRFEKDIQDRDTFIERLSKEEKVQKNWTIYQTLVGKNGIIKIALRKALPVINNEICRVLNGLCDFSVELSISDDNKVCIDMIKGGEHFDLGTCASGFETVMSSLAIRHSLASMATLSKPNFCVFDEILEGVGVSNYDNVKELFKRIVKNYDFIIHITHNEMVADWHDNIITVTKNNDISVLKLLK